MPDPTGQRPQILTPSGDTNKVTGADITTPRMWHPPPITKPETVVVGRVGWGFVLGPVPITKQKEAPPRQSGNGASLDFN